MRAIEKELIMTLAQTENHNDYNEGDVLIHVRYFANGAVMFIDKCPAQLTALEWREMLLKAAPGLYQTFAGARGFFRLPRHIYDSLLATMTPMAVA